MNPGLIFAALTILLFGSWAVPTKTLKIEPKVQAFWLTVGHFIVSIFIFATLSREVSKLQNYIGPFIAGILWAIGITLGYIAIKNLGITRALGIWIPINILVGAFWGLIFFGEAKLLGTQKLVQSLFGIALLISAAFAVISSSKAEKIKGNIQLGILTAIGIGLLHGSVFVPLKVSSLPFAAIYLPWSLGMVLTTTTIVMTQNFKLLYEYKSILRMLSGGFMLGIGNYLALLTIKYLGYGNGFALTQLAIVVNTLWGALVFKEVTTTRGKILIAAGVIIALIGAIVLNSARI